MSPAGCVVSDWECVRSTSYVYPDSNAENAQAAAYAAEGFEVALHPNVISCPTDPHPSPSSTPPSTPTQRPPAPSTRACPHLSRTEPLRLLARLDDVCEGRARPRDAHGRQLLPLSRQLDRREARLHQRGRLPDALGRDRRNPLDVYQANTNMHRRERPGLSGNGEHAPQQRHRCRSATTAPSGSTCTPTTHPAPGRRSSDRVRPRRTVFR